MDKLINKLSDEMCCWKQGLVTNNKISAHEVLHNYAYEYCIKEEIINYFLSNIISDNFMDFLLKQENILEYLYYEYIKDDTVNIHNEIEGFIDNLIYKFKIQP